MRHDSVEQASNGRVQERTGLQYQQYAQGLAEAVEQQQAASRAAVHWQEVLDMTEDRHARRYFEGLVKLSTLKALHHNLIAQSFERAGQDAAFAAVNRDDHESKAQTVAGETASPVKVSSEIALIERVRNRALAEYDAHHAKTESFSLLGDRYRELGNDRMARTCHERARLESAAARGFDTAVKAYDKKIEDLDIAKPTKEVCPDFRSSFRGLEHAERYLKDYDNGYAMVRNHTRRVMENETRIQRLEAACASRPRPAVEHQLLKDAVDRGEKLKWLAEAEAFDTVGSYKNFQKEIASAEKAYDALTRALTGNPAELTNVSPARDASENTEHSQTLREAQGNLEGPGRSVTETRSSQTTIKEPELDKPGDQARGPDLNPATASGHPQHRPGAGAVLGQILKEMDREL